MKNLFLALTVAFGVSFQAQALDLAAPLWACKLSGKIDNTASQVELLLIRGEQVSGHGMVVCRDAFGRKVKNHVNLQMTSAGVGPAINSSLEGLRIYAARVGVSSLDGMIGQYDFNAGPRLGLIHARAGLMGGVQVAGQSLGAEIEAVIENRFSVGVDVGAMILTVTPAGKRRR